MKTFAKYRVAVFVPLISIPLGIGLFAGGIVSADPVLEAMVAIQSLTVIAAVAAYVAGVRAGMPRSEPIVIVLTLAACYAAIAAYITISFAHSSGKLFG